MFPKLIQAGLYSEGERDIYAAYIHQPHSHAHNQKGEGRPPLSFLKIEKSVLILERKTLIVSIFGLNVPFKMQFQEYIGKKVPKWLHVRPLFPAFLTKCLTKCPSSTNHHPPFPPCHEKLLVEHLHSGNILFAKRSILHAWQCCEYVCLDNSSEICIMTL